MCSNTKACNGTQKGAQNSQVRKGLQCRQRGGEGSNKLVARQVPVSKQRQGQPAHDVRQYQRMHNLQVHEGLQRRPRGGEGSDKLVAKEDPVNNKHPSQPA